MRYIKETDFIQDIGERITDDVVARNNLKWQRRARKLQERRWRKIRRYDDNGDAYSWR